MSEVRSLNHTLVGFKQFHFRYLLQKRKGRPIFSRYSITLHTEHTLLGSENSIHLISNFVSVLSGTLPKYSEYEMMSSSYS